MIFNLQAIPQISDTFYLEQAKPAADRLTPQDFMSHVLTILVQNPHVNPGTEIIPITAVKTSSTRITFWAYSVTNQRNEQHRFELYRDTGQVVSSSANITTVPLNYREFYTDVNLITLIQNLMIVNRVELRAPLTTSTKVNIPITISGVITEELLRASINQSASVGDFFSRNTRLTSSFDLENLTSEIVDIPVAQIRAFVESTTVNAEGIPMTNVVAPRQDGTAPTATDRRVKVYYRSGTYWVKPSWLSRSVHYSYNKEDATVWAQRYADRAGVALDIH